MNERPASVTRTIVLFAVLGVVALAVVSVAGVLVIRRVAEDQATEEAEQLTEVSSRIVQRRVDDLLLTGDAEATVSVGGVVFDAVLLEPVVGVSIRTAEGEIVYADAPDLITTVEPLTPAEAAVIAGDSGITVVPASVDPARVEGDEGELVAASARIETPEGVPLLFQTLHRASALEATEREVLDTFAPRLVTALVVFAAVAGLLAWGLIRRVTNAARERTLLLQRVVDAQDRERRRIAGDLHDGPVQDLAGLAMSLSAKAQTLGDPASRDAIDGSAEAVRASVRTLRSAIVGVYPPNLQQAGLGQALSDLTSRLPREGLDVTLDVEEPAGYAPAIDELLYRACQEALRNVESHASASRVAVSVRREGGRVVLEVADDGVGVDASERPRADGHLGLRILRDLVADAGGTLRVAAGDGGGTVLRVEVRAVIRVAIADDHRVVRVGLEQLLATFDDVELVGSAVGGEDAVALCEREAPDVLLLDLEMPDLDGIGVTTRLAASAPATRVVVFTSFGDRERIVQALDAGAIGYLLKDAEPEEIRAALRAAARGEAPLAPKAAAALLSERGGGRVPVDLTARERDVLALVLEGLANKQIARRLGISEKTVKGHLTNLFQRIGVTDRTQAALWAERTGALRP